MEKLTSEQIRKAWKDFFESPEVNHKWLEPSSLIPDSQDKTVLFNTAGMQQLVPYLVGKPHPLGKRVYNIQKCVRTGDIDDVGDERHLTFFEMMGNWSLGDYFKKEAISWSYQFLTKYLKIEHERLGTTVFQGEGNIAVDEESIGYWLNLGVPQEKIRKLSSKDNFWGPAGNVGPCGPCSEMYIDRGDDYGPADWNIGDNDRYVEVWNDVFMEFYKDENGEYTKLKQQNVDTGMGLERLCMILQGKETVFETDIFDGIISVIEKYTGLKYPPYSKKEKEFSDSEKQITRRFRIIADHIRTSTLLIGDGVIPSNEGRGYVLRRIIRRAYYSFDLLKKDFDVSGFINDVFSEIEKKYGNYRREIVINKENIKKTLLQEINQFQKTISRGIRLLEELIAKGGSVISGKDIFTLYDTYGFPLELTKEIAETYSFKLDLEGYEKSLEEAKEKSRAGTKDMFKRGVDWAKYLEGIPTTIFLGYDSLDESNIKLLKEVDVEGQKVLIFDKTPFYAESGGQTGDRGNIILDDGRKFEVIDVQKYAGVFLHFVK